MDKDFIRKFNAKLEESLVKVRQSRMEDERKQLMSTIGQDLAKMLAPFLNSVATTARANKEDLREVMAELAGQLDSRQLNIDTAPLIDAIQSAIGGIQIPQPKVTVAMPPVNVPQIKMPDEMNIKGFVSLMGVDLDNPLPVQLRDKDGRPVNLSEQLSTMIVSGGGGGGGFRRIIVDDIKTSSGASLISDAESALKVTGSFSAALAAAYGSGEVGTDTLRIAHATDSVASVNVRTQFGTTYTDTSMLNGDNRLRVSVETGGSGLTDAELRAAHLDVLQLSGSVNSVYVTGASGTLSANIIDSDGNTYGGDNPMSVKVTDVLKSIAANVVDSSGVAYSGSNPMPIGGTVLASDITASIKAALIDSSGNQYSGSNPFTVNVADIAKSVAASIVDSSGVQYSGANPVPVALISGALTSTIVTGTTVSDAADDGSAPVKTGGIARTDNPSAVAAGDTVSFSADKIGRQLTRPVNARDLIVTAYATLATGSGYGTETTLKASGSGVMLDLIEVLATNDSTAAAWVDLRASTGGTVCKRIMIPAGGTAGVSLQVPYPAPFADHTWTIDADDLTGTNITVTALFSKEI